ncbi:hypothetical protein HMPREF9318_00055 [Streptococcus urinalis FB127-CNA-2]|uniref:DUF3102 domain-containing protein n=1 Tax=Streptococcus urinalis 2285-97 TaxID=764291 RepID=G5KEG1_9STRE|nr:DUF3102 domain-containing protein [Streptococcus urinalis]QBX31575.1 hypothetical protein Javan642_0011 [Streptococcus phage Javan642]QBX31680.1 hypothetical protein Javan648_0054 [Streptococcus phage Javan648]EHJ56641.1 hypothetical protein STRUR_0795 [Streptococcus urinalis 2285-97]EKS21857.1 hypothetical protein HMPREF9318_00055 [Streptococcus urinalis FB127-CNA-2]VEF31670.1 Uncharacterised protein [Streptococcus urinalis]
MNEVTLSNNLQQIELEINHHKNIAGQSIWEIGRRLKHVKENDLAHGQFMEWLGKLGINQPEANRMMKVANELPNSSTLSNLGSTALYLIATLPDEAKQEQIERIESGDNPTVRELQEIKRENNRLKAENARLEQQKENLAEQTLSAKIVEKEVIKEVIPDDYESTKSLNSDLLKKNKQLSKTLEETEWELDSKKLELATIKLESQRAIEVTDQIRHLEGKKEKLENLVTSISELSSIISDVQNFFDTKMAPLRFKPIINNVNAHYSVTEVTKMVNTVQSWCDEMYKIIPSGNRKIIEEVIINE